MHTPQHLPRTHRFTLLELLVVVAVIALLASLLLPALSKARAEAMKAGCRSQQRQLYLGHLFYADASDDWFLMVDWNSMAAIPLTSPSLLEPYGADRRVFRCPATSFAGTDNHYQVLKVKSNELLTSYRFAASRGSHATGSGWFYGNYVYSQPLAANSSFAAPFARLSHLGRLVTDPASLTKSFVHDGERQPMILDGVSAKFFPKWHNFSSGQLHWNNHETTGSYNLLMADGHGQAGRLLADPNRMAVYDAGWLAWK